MVRGGCPPSFGWSGLLIRYADDFVVVCSHERDARRLHVAIEGRLRRFGLTLHPDKTRTVRFVRPRHDPRSPRRSDQLKPGTFDFLGFTHYWGVSRRGRWTVKRKTAKDRYARAIRKIALWCRRNRHLPIAWQHLTLTRTLRGHDAYYGITGNGEALQNLRHAVSCVWRKWLDRRAHRAKMTWARFSLLLERYPLPPARVVHSVFQRRAAKPSA